MRNIIKLTGLFVLIVFSFFYTDKVAQVVRELDPLMTEIENVMGTYKVDVIEAVVEDNTIIPGINGRSINVEYSYKNMRQKGIFNKDLLEYDIVEPSVTLDNSLDKFIVKGNSNRQMVSIIFILDSDKYLDRIENIANSKDVVINYFVTYDYLISNSTTISNMSNREVYNYGDNGDYSPDSLLFDNNLISRITDNNAIYCLSRDKNEDILNICKNNNLYTIVPNIVADSNIYNIVKNELSSGSIILISANNNNIIELGITIDYILGKGIKIGGLSNLLTEDLA